MLPFCIDAEILGTDKHLSVSDAGYSWRMMPPAETWHLTGKIKPTSDWCLDSLLRLANINIDTQPPGAFVNAILPLLSGSGYSDLAPPWQLLMPSQAHRAFVKNVVSQVIDALVKLPIDYYVNTWVPGNGVIRSLKRAKVDVSAWQALIDAEVGNARVVETFKPDSQGYAGTVHYDRFGTLTGRLTVKEGPSILTLKREYRSLIVPKTDGCIFSLDFAALEARLLLYEAGRRCDDPDLYAMIANELEYERKAVKGAVISELYGSSKWALGNALGIKGKELDDFVKRIKMYFNTQALLKRIKQQFFETGKIINRYGRPVVIDEPLDHIFINYYAQSSGVDVTLLGFSQLAERLAIEAPDVRILYLLHDAMIVDVPRKHFDLIESIKAVTVPGYVQSFPLKVERLSCVK